jgi:N-methylhydantoinase A
MSLRVAVDIGGTFTDLIAFDESSQEIRHAKSPTTARDPVQGLLDCIRKAQLKPQTIDSLIHGSTIAINTLIEGKGATVGLIVTRGTRDVYFIGRGNRVEAYNLLFHRPRPLVPRHRTIEVAERLYSSGKVREPLNVQDVEAACAELARNGADAVAVCFLHSYANPEHERVAGRIVEEKLPGCYVSMSHEILREYREYERTSTTVINAYIGPTVGGYVQKLHTQLDALGFRGELSIMQSNGGVMSAEAAVRRPVMMMESGPVGGIIASAEIGNALGYKDVISFDMGGTTAKVSLIRGAEPTMAEGYYVGGYASGHPVMAPVVDIVEVGAGGGSLAWIDEVSALKVGPESSGSMPGPICYGRGGQKPTITDANVILGRIGVSDFLGGEMRLDRDGALRGMAEHIAGPLQMEVAKAALSVVQIANAKMSLAVREVSVEKGYDPRDFVLIASGGAGPVHAASIARELHIPTVIVPRFPAHFSALGMLMADERHDFIQTYFSELETANFSVMKTKYEEMMDQAQQLLTPGSENAFKMLLDIRYVGQEFTLPVPVSMEQIESSDRDAIRYSFDALHEQRYAHHSTEERVEIINMRLAGLGRRPKLAFSPLAKRRKAVEREQRQVYFEQGDAPILSPVYARDDLPAGAELNGPALISEYGSTTMLSPSDQLVVADTGELIISIGRGQ